MRSPAVKNRCITHMFCCGFTASFFFFFFTLKVADDDLVVVRAREEMMGSGGEAHRSNVAAVGAVRLHDAPPFNVVQHAGAVLLTRGQQAAAGVHRHRGHRTSCVRGATKRGGDSSLPARLRGSARHSPEPCRDVPTTRTQLGTRRSQKRTVLSWEPDAIIHPPQANTVRMWPVETVG